MLDRISGRILRALAAAAILTGAVAMTSPVSAAPPTAVDFTVRESLPAGTPGVMISSDIAGCATATVATIDASRVDKGPITTFRGTKVIDCGGGDTFSLTFRARVRGCSPTDHGTWKVIAGTGAFSGAKGHGQLVGSYRYDGGAGTSCLTDGIDDHYTGRLKLAT
jgi:hypothetical protein